MWKLIVISNNNSFKSKLIGIISTVDIIDLRKSGIGVRTLENTKRIIGWHIWVTNHGVIPLNDLLSRASHHDVNLNWSTNSNIVKNLSVVIIKD